MVESKDVEMSVAAQGGGAGRKTAQLLGLGRVFGLETGVGAQHAQVGGLGGPHWRASRQWHPGTWAAEKFFVESELEFEFFGRTELHVHGQFLLPGPLGPESF